MINMCLHGTCQPDGTCACDAGWVDHTMMFWTQNCGMPASYAQCFGAALVAASCVTAVELMCTLRGRSALSGRLQEPPRGWVRRVLWLGVGLEIFNAAAGAAVAVERAATPVFWTLVHCAIFFISMASAVSLRSLFLVAVRPAGIVEAQIPRMLQAKYAVLYG